MSWFTPKSSSRSPLEIAGIERRLRTEANAARTPLPQGLQRRTLDALRDVEPKRRAFGSFRQPSSVTSMLGLVGAIVLTLAVSMQMSSPRGENTRVRPSIADASAPRDVTSTLRAFTTLAILDFSSTTIPNPLADEAQSLMRDATRALQTLWTTVPNRLRPQRVRDDASLNNDA